MEQQIDVKAIREELQCTQSLLAEAVGVDQGTLSAWENNKHQPTRAARKTLERLLKEHRARAPKPSPSEASAA